MPMPRIADSVDEVCDEFDFSVGLLGDEGVSVSPPDGGWLAVSNQEFRWQVPVAMVAEIVATGRALGVALGGAP